jgi:glycosyltransferase involved in cell wall biosynthesis
MKLSVVIPCYNMAATVAETLDAFASERWSEPWEVIVADNGCTDDSMAVVGRYTCRLPALRIVDASARRGAACALNIGIQAARGESVGFCDADDVIGPGWVATMGKALQDHDFVACSIETQKLNLGSWASGLHPNVQQSGLQKLWYPPYLPHAGAGTLGVRKRVHQLLGGFDESMPYVFETDYCVRAQLSGVNLHFVPDATVHVRYRKSMQAMFRQSRLWAEYNVMLYSRHRPPGHRELWRWKEYGRRWRSLIMSIPMRATPTERARWLWGVAWQIGLLKGSLKHGVPPI